MADIEVTEETCLERGGEWVADDEASNCVWPEFDREGCDKDDDREDDSNEAATSQEECEANGGTWSEDRQQCY